MSDKTCSAAGVTYAFCKYCIRLFVSIKVFLKPFIPCVCFTVSAHASDLLLPGIRRVFFLVGVFPVGFFPRLTNPTPFAYWNKGVSNDLLLHLVHVVALFGEAIQESPRETLNNKDIFVFIDFALTESSYYVTGCDMAQPISVFIRCFPNTYTDQL